LLTDCGVRY